MTGGGPVVFSGRKEIYPADVEFTAHRLFAFRDRETGRVRRGSRKRPPSGKDEGLSKSPRFEK